LYLTHCRLREFRGQTLYAVPSMFLDELPEDGVEHVDLSASAGGTMRAMEAWRGATAAASSGWYDTGFARGSTKRNGDPAPRAGYAVGALVMHDSYGVGKIIDISGQGALRKLKVRFSTGERTFIAEKAKLSIVES
jgi:DNA helicase-2/ATP-dependent DNA helicase PcrA